MTVYYFPELDEVSSGQPTLHGKKAKCVQPLSICHFRDRLYALGPLPLHTFKFPSTLHIAYVPGTRTIFKYWPDVGFEKNSMNSGFWHTVDFRKLWQSPEALWDTDSMCSCNFGDMSTVNPRSRWELTKGNTFSFRTYCEVTINNVARHLKSHYKIFADDIKIYMCVSKTQFDVQSVQSDINLLQATASSLGLSMNSKKCAVIRFQRRFHEQARPLYYLNGEELPWTHSHTDLGVTIDDTLWFHGQARVAVRKAGGIAHSFLKATLCRDPDFMLHILCTHIRPVLEYASVVWNTGYNEVTRRLEAVQRFWTRHTKCLGDMDYGERLKYLDLYSVKGRLLRTDLIKCWKIFHGLCPIKPSVLWDTSTERRTRGNRFKIRVRHC